MAYINIDELKRSLEKRKVAELSNDESAQDDNAVLNELIYEAQSTVDSYVGMQYSVPLSEPVAPVVRDVTKWITIYSLHMRRPSWTVSEELRAHYEDAIAWLKQVASGKALIPGLVQGGKLGSAAYFGAETRIFQGISHDNSSDMMSGF